MVLLPGSGDTAESWVAVQDRLNRLKRVLTYDRSGMGGSDPAPTADLSGVVEEFDAVLSATGIATPVVLVSHSFGGLLARLYTATHPERVVGLVLLDATPPAIADDPGVRIGFLISTALA